jgi:predicted amidohydrolase YtcJ
MEVTNLDRTFIVRASTVITMDIARPRAEAIAIADGSIAAVGSASEVQAAAGKGAEIVDVAGGAVLPGFIDPHHHYCMSAFERTLPDVELRGAVSVDDILTRLERAVRESAPGGWLRAQGYNPDRLHERRAPRREELDAVCLDRPLLLISWTFHEGCLNSRGLAELGWSERTPDPPQGRLVRDRRRRLTGEIGERALFAAEAASRGSLLARADDAWLAECEAHGEALLRKGITRVGDAAVAPVFERLYQRALADGRLPITVHRMPVSARTISEPRLDAEPTGTGPSHCPAGPAKLILDGAERCAVCVSLAQVVQGAAVMARGIVSGTGLAALRAIRRTAFPRIGRDGHVHSGTLLWDRGRLEATVAQAARSGLQVAQHAVGNEAVALAVAAIERAGGGLDGLPGRPRIEHVVFADRRLARRMADAGVAAVVQPRWVHEMGDDLQLLPLAPAIRRLPLNTLRDAGADLALSSDFPAADYDVISAVQSAATRRTRTGASLEPEEALGVEEALRGYTTTAARVLGVEREAGSIEPGKRADLVVLSADPLSADPDRLGEIKVKRTYVSGHLAFRCDGHGASLA